MTQLSAHFSLEELTRSQVALRRGLDNVPDELAVTFLTRLCSTLLEPVRTLLNIPLHVDSGYRSAGVNIAVGGAAGSAHMYGRAADIIPIGLDLHEAFNRIRVAAASLPVDQLICECNAWLHLAIAPDGAQPRREFLTASGTPGHWYYSLVPSESA